MNKTNIPWTDYTWNPTTGCELPLASEGCVNCYARKLHNMRHKAYLAGKTGLPNQYAKPFDEIQLFPHRLEEPLRKKTTFKIFVGSMADLFSESVPFEFIDKIFAVMALCQRHTFQVLTKRPERMGEYFSDFMARIPNMTQIAIDMKLPFNDCIWTLDGEQGLHVFSIPIPNLWLGTSISTQADADNNIPELLQIPAAVRFVSAEPLLEHLNIGCYLKTMRSLSMADQWFQNKLDWVIVGAESGPNRRPCKIEWVRSIVEQCKAAGVAVFVKQLDIDGKLVTDINKFPEDLRIREFPNED